MNGPHDMGGMQCFGALPLEPEEPVFHAEWERRALALTLAAGALGHWGLDESRHARE
ncbi:MAG: nitrile hydratase subunit beta, partial [Alphaproteobacteria bacterium HGW-Alphaproteobacteria-2]